MTVLIEYPEAMDFDVACDTIETLLDDNTDYPGLSAMEFHDGDLVTAPDDDDEDDEESAY